MTKKIILLFSHQLTNKQKQNAKTELGVLEFVSLPDKLQKVWSNVPPELDDITGFLEDIRLWLASINSNNDYVLIQGDFGATYYFVNWALKNKLIPIYATTKRIHKEKLNEDGSVKIIKMFEHERFRKYNALSCFLN